MKRIRSYNASLFLVGLLLLSCRTVSAATLATAITRYGPAAEARLTPHFQATDIPYPPRQLRFLTIKAEKALEVWAGAGQHWRLIKRYPILAASGTLGPKLREGDAQVPEGLYRIVALNPNSAFHLSMQLNYPNAFDRLQAQREGRTHPGSDIFIHGGAASIGCLAIGDSAIEELFTLVHRTGLSHVEVIITPTDPRRAPLRPPPHSPAWVTALYDQLTAAIRGWQ
ncbi:MAG: L,D-transpeptidase family protein [Deltaproteobacteria bacterium]|nr:L,D-transpeptidase family protein [Deltaproteobacteria bacterium]